MNDSTDAIRIRSATADDWQAIFDAHARAFGNSAAPGDLAAWKRRVDPDDILVAEDLRDPDRQFLVGTAMYYRMRIAVPGGTIPIAGGGMTLVAATHQRRGIFRKMYTELLALVADRGYLAIAGMPSKATIYGRFGLGVATYRKRLEIDLRHAELRLRPTTQSRSCEMNADEAILEMPEIYQRWHERTPGAVSRDEAWWIDLFEDRITQRRNRSPLFFIVHPDGYVTYRIAPDVSGGVVSVEDFCAITDEAHTELLQTLLGLEMFEKAYLDAAVNDPIALKLTDLRAVRTTAVEDHLWLRIMDIPAALTARRYHADSALVIEVEDPLDRAGGLFRLDIQNGVADCIRTDNSPDVRIGLAELGSLYLGGHSASGLARAGRLTEIRAGAVETLDRTFKAEREPFCGTSF